MKHATLEPETHSGDALPTAVELALAKPPRAPISIVPLSAEQSDYYSRIQALESLHGGPASRRELLGSLDKLAFFHGVSAQAVRDDFVRNEMAARGRPWEQVAKKYDLTHQAPLAPLTKTAGVADRLDAEAEQARKRAEEARNRAEGEQVALQNANVAVRHAEEALAAARQKARGLPSQLAAVDHHCLTAWTTMVSPQEFGAHYQNRALARAALDDFPRVEKLLVEQLAAATAERDKLQRELT